MDSMPLSILNYAFSIMKVAIYLKYMSKESKCLLLEVYSELLLHILHSILSVYSEYTWSMKLKL